MTFRYRPDHPLQRRMPSSRDSPSAFFQINDEPVDRFGHDTELDGSHLRTGSVLQV
jgi:hypothetical protein